MPDNSSQRDQPSGHPATSGTREDAVELTFPDLPRLELDQLLAQLVERAQEVMATQGRLRGLLRATQTVTSGLSLPVVLRRIAEAARELVGARYAALGVLAPEGGLAEFVHVGMDDELAARIGHLPEGKGLLGALIEDPRPIRLARIADDPRSCGFPPDHPPMTSFLGVPIRVRDEVFGNLYLAESVRGEFTADDEELIKALAATAATVIDNARLYEAARERGEWLQASATIARRLLSADLDEIDSLRLIAEHSREVAHADLVTVVLPDDDGEPARRGGGRRGRRRRLRGCGCRERARCPGGCSRPARRCGWRLPTSGPTCTPRYRTASTPARCSWCRWWARTPPTACSPWCGCAAGRRSPPRTSTWPPASPTRPPSPSSSPGPAPTSSGPPCSTSANASPRTCTTT